ncbi:MAG TPA: PadR family transcriptional regulator [Chloroflexi bacterium]|nr:PadR family transcriptional regulator [Chloroflexota bacterium]
MKLEYFIIGLLKLKPLTGYDLKKFLDIEGRFIRRRTPLSQIYNTLNRMAENGLLTFENELQEGKPDRKVYTVTSKGDEYFMAWLTAPHQPSFRFQERDFLGKIMFAYYLDTPTILQQLRTELDYRKEQIAAFRPRSRALQVSPAFDGNLEHAQAIADLLHEYGASSVDHYVSWLESTIQFFENWNAD